MNRLNDYFRLARIQNYADKISTVESQLRGAACKWDGTQKRTRELTPNMKRFLEYFNLQDKISAATTMLYGEKHNANQSVGDSITNKLELFERVSPDLPDHVKANILLGQIDSEIRSRLRGTTFTSVSVLKTAAVNVESDVIESISQNKFRPMTMNSVRYPNVQGPPKKPSTSKPPSACKYCGEWHYNSQCEKNPYRNKNEGENKTHIRPNPTSGTSLKN